jgi:hypothetical protein
LMLWVASAPSSTPWMGRSLDVIWILFFAVNLPGAVVGNGLLTLLIDWPDWAKSLTASVAVWLLWYAIIRMWEWWKARSGPVELPKL